MGLIFAIDCIGLLLHLNQPVKVPAFFKKKLKRALGLRANENKSTTENASNHNHYGNGCNI